MAEQESKKEEFNPVDMIIYQFRDHVGEHKKDVLGIRKLAFLQGTSYNEAMEGIFHFCQAVAKDVSTGDDGSNEPIVETVAFGPKSAGVTWCPCPFNINIIATIENESPLNIKLEGCIEFSARGIKLNEHFSGEVGDNPKTIPIINTDKFTVNAMLTSQKGDDKVTVSLTIPCEIKIAGHTIKNTYQKDIKIPKKILKV